MMPTLSPATVDLIIALVEAGIKAAPAIIDAITRACQHTDPLAGLAQEKLDEIVAGGLHLPILIAAAKVRAEAMVMQRPLSVPSAPEVTVTP